MNKFFDFSFLFLSMSYYITYKEIPAKLLEKIIQKPKDEEYHQELLRNWYLEVEKQWETKINPTDVQNAPYRILHFGNVMSSDTLIPKDRERKNRFLDILRENKNWEQSHKFVQDIFDPANCSEIYGYRSAQQIQSLWKIMEKTLQQYSEFKIDNMFAPIEIFQETESDVDDFIRYYYGCAKRKSADLLIEG